MAKDFGELALVLGDAHVPGRAPKIPAKLKRMLVPNKMQHVLCTGNMGSREQYEELRALAPTQHFVSGDDDDDFPEETVTKIGDVKVGIVHGHDVQPWGDAKALEARRRRLDVDVLISGHTHRAEVREEGDYLYLNPGSITGAYAPATNEVVPSFILLAVQGPKVVVYLYELHGDSVDVSKSEFTAQPK